MVIIEVTSTLYRKVTSCPREVTLRVSVELSPLPLKVTSHGREVTLGPLCRVVPSTPQSHLTCIFSPCVHILTSRTYSHLTCPPPPFKVTSRTHSHLTVHILTSHTYSHLVCPPPPFKVTSHTHSYLMYTFSPRVHILTSCAPSTIQSHLMPTSSTHSHLTYIFSPRMLPSTENNIFHLVWKNSQKSHAATPIPSIRYLLRATKKLNFLKINHLCLKTLSCASQWGKFSK